MPLRTQDFRELCFACDHFEAGRCLRCSRFACRRHRGDESSRRCTSCEDEYESHYRHQRVRSAGRTSIAVGLPVMTCATFFPDGGYSWGAAPLCAGIAALVVGFYLLDRADSPRQLFLRETPRDLRRRRGQCRPLAR